jgi:hypothetical protein
VRNHYLRLFITFVLCVGFIYTPILQAAQLSLPSGDLIAPEISHEALPNSLDAGSSVQIKAKVTDNVGVKSVTLFFRTKGAQEYKRAAMNRLGDTDEFAVTLGKDDLVAPGIDYYIQAMDLAGNSVLQGYSFSPLSVSVVPPTTPKASQGEESVAGKTQPSGETIKEEPAGGKKKSKTWLWIALGALAVGVVAAAASGGSGGSSSSSSTGTVVITAPSP